MLKLNNDITSILKAYLKCDEISCNNYGTYVLIFRLHYKKKIYCKKCYNKILDKYYSNRWDWI